MQACSSQSSCKVCWYKVQYRHSGSHLATHVHMSQLEILSSTPSNSLTCIHNFQSQQDPIDLHALHALGSKCPAPIHHPQNAHFPIEHGVPTICHSPQNVCVQIKKLLQCSEPLSLKGIMRNDNCKQACPSICKNNSVQNSS